MQAKKQAKATPRRILARVLLGYLLFAVVFFWASGKQLFFEKKYTDSVTAKYTAAIMTDGTTVTFSVHADTDLCDYVSPLIGTASSAALQGQLLAEMLDENGTVIAKQVIEVASLSDYVYAQIKWPESISWERGKDYTVRITAEGTPIDSGVSLWYGDSITTGRFTVQAETKGSFTVNGTKTDGTICYQESGRNNLLIGKLYWPVAGVLFLAILAYGLYTIQCINVHKMNKFLYYIELYRRYSFLVRQLVARDFKRKYKRSVLGVFWSFLNPLLTMMVQYLVFNTLFKSSIQNFVVYLLSGIVLFNFFSEAVGMGLTSITDNTSLINKVYMPKVIYPLSRTLSSAINLLISLIPLLGATILSGLPLTKAVVLLPLGLIMLFAFCLGLAMLLATSMVYFRDTFFLWGVVSVLWAYLTPTFYPITIVPGIFRPIFKLNPMYQYITFVRSILIDGIAPAPLNYLGCLLSAVIMLVVGWMVFKKNQKYFILHL